MSRCATSPARSGALLLALAVFAIGRPAPGAEADCLLRVGWDPYEPYSYAASDDGTAAGFDIDVVSEAAAASGCSVAFEKMEWDAVLAALRAGRIDVAVGTGYKPDRAAWSHYSEPYRKEVIGLLVRAGTAAEFAGTDLEQVFGSGLDFGRTTGDSYDAETEAVFAKYPDQVHDAVDEEENIARLLSGAIDGFLVEVNVAGAVMGRLGVTDRLELHPLRFDAGDYRLQMSGKTVPAELALRMNAAIQELKANGWLEKTMQRRGIRQ